VVRFRDTEQGEWRAMVAPKRIRMCGECATHHWLAETACLPGSQKSNHSPESLVEQETNVLLAQLKLRNSIPLVVGIHNGRKRGVFIGTTIRGGPVLNSTETVAPETASMGWRHRGFVGGLDSA
jgi:hypothetical protein